MEETSQQSSEQVPVHRQKLTNDTPETLTKLLYGVVSLLERYGWVIVLCLVICWFLFEKLKPQLYEWKTRRDEYNDKKNEDPEKVCSQQEKQATARRRMQEKIDADAERHKERQQQLEMERRREKIEDWERHQDGQGYRSKTKMPDTSNQTPGFIKPKPKFKNTLRQSDYNPLTGQGGGSFKPTARRGPSGGGGGG